jgi:hypothetical protein
MESGKSGNGNDSVMTLESDLREEIMIFIFRALTCIVDTTGSTFIWYTFLFFTHLYVDMSEYHRFLSFLKHYVHPNDDCLGEDVEIRVTHHASRARFG